MTYNTDKLNSTHPHLEGVVGKRGFLLFVFTMLFNEKRPKAKGANGT